MAIRRDKYDAVISDLVRSRSDFVCERCGHVDHDGQMTRKSLTTHASHFNSRGAGHVCRYDTDMIFCLCATCHKLVGDRPGEHATFVISRIGQGLYDRKLELHNKPYKFTPGEKDDMHKHHKAELVRVNHLRANGAQGYISTVSWF